MLGSGGCFVHLRCRTVHSSGIRGSMRQHVMAYKANDVETVGSAAQYRTGISTSDNNGVSS
jgi:hypothetical protein